MKVSLKIGAPAKWAGRVVPIGVDRFVIGRDPDCQLRPGSSRIAKRHCAVLLRGDKVFLRDLDSSTGTSINGRQIKGEIELLHDDLLGVGPLLLVVCIESTARATASRPQPREGIDDDAIADMLLFMEKAVPDAPAIEVGADTVDTPLASTQSDKPATGPTEGLPSRLPPLGKPRQDASGSSREIMRKLLGLRD